MSARRHRQQLQRIAAGDDLFAFRLDGPQPLVNLSSGWQRRKIKLQAGSVEDFGEFDRFVIAEAHAACARRELMWAPWGICGV